MVGELPRQEPAVLRTGKSSEAGASCVCKGVYTIHKAANDRWAGLGKLRRVVMVSRVVLGLVSFCCRLKGLTCKRNLSQKTYFVSNVN